MTTFKDMWQMLWELIYDILAIFGVTVDDEGNLEKAE